MSKRVLIVVAAALAAAAVAAFVLQPPRGVPDDAPTLDQMTGSVGAPIMEHIFRGHVPGRSGEIMLVPKPHRFVIGEWDLTTLGTNSPELYTSHPNPWGYLSHVPMIFYGPGYVNRGVEASDEVDLVDISPTYAELVGMDGFESEGGVLTDALSGERARPPKVIFTVVIDGGGWNVLEQHPSAHPTIDSLRADGTTYVNATIGSAPSITGALHGTLGTGYYPVDHGIPGNQMRAPEGAPTSGDDPTVDTWLDNSDPTYLQLPTMSELWDEQNGNRPFVGSVSYEGWHLGMIGHGAQRDGGDKDVAALWKAHDNEWWINEDYYKLPSYLDEADVSDLEAYERALDERDGLRDGNWFGHTLEELQEDAVRPGTPAFVRWTGDAAVKMMRNEEIGTDALTDLVWIELKAPDFGGHIWNMLGPEQGDILFETDRQIARFKRVLDEIAGEGNYVLAITADHGQQPLPEPVGGWRINARELERDINERFGAPIVFKSTSVEIFMNLDQVEEAGVDLADVARYIGSYTIGDNIPEGRAGIDRVPEARLDERLFAGAFPTDFIASLTPERISAFGASDYPEGTLTLERSTGGGD
ncbi:MAG: alkaline phosphatase family protein [Actinomycetota bacterium]